jgi:hypothetical protein
MSYKQKLRALLCLVGVLALVFAGTLVFDPQRVNSRSSAFAWLPADGRDRADRIEVYRFGEEGVTLIRKNNEWFVPSEGLDLPAKPGRVEDLLRLLSSRGSYPLRASSSAAHERLGLMEETASRIVIRGGAGAYPLLDLLIGNEDAAGNEVYLRKNSQNEVRSGEDKLSAYVNGSRASWLNLRLFPETTPGPDAVQRVTLVFPGDWPGASPEASPREPLILTRKDRDWTMEGAAGTPDTRQVESYIRAVLDAEGEDFISAMNPADPVFKAPHILLEMGDGAVRSIRLGPQEPAEGGSRRSASVSGSPYVYALAEWTVNRILREGSYFVTQ